MRVDGSVCMRSMRALLCALAALAVAATNADNVSAASPAPSDASAATTSRSSAAADLAMLRRSTPSGFAFVSFGNGSQPGVEAAGAIMLTATLLLTLTEWLPANTSRITRAWSEKSDVGVKRVWLGRDFPSTNSSSAVASSPFAVIELERALSPGVNAVVTTAAAPAGQLQGDFVLTYTDPGLFRLPQTRRYVWEGQVVGKTCAERSDAYCALASQFNVNSSVTELGPVPMGFLTQSLLRSKYKNLLGVLVRSSTSTVRPDGSSNNTLTFVRPGVEPHKSFLAFATKNQVEWRTSAFETVLKSSLPSPASTDAPVDAVPASTIVLHESSSSSTDDALDCAGLQLMATYIVTTASCLLNRTVTHVSLNAKRVAVLETIVHPLFHAPQQSSSYDVALLRLTDTLSNTGRIAKLDTVERASGTQLVRMDLSSRAADASRIDTVEILDPPACSLASGLAAWCVRELPAQATAPTLSNASTLAALFLATRGTFAFVGFQLQPHASSRLVRVIDALNFLRGTVPGLSGRRDQTGAFALPESKRYVVGLRITPSGQNFCAGALIAPTYVLTAAHCVADGIVNWVTVGSNSAAGTAYETIRVVPGSIVVHPDFGSPFSYSHDAAVFEIIASPMARAIALETTLEFTDQPRASVSSYANAAAGSNDVTFLSLPVWSTRACALQFPDMVDASVLCAGGELGLDTCGGDSGSPLTLVDSATGADTLIGLVSSGFECGFSGSPGFYTRVATLADFVQRHVVHATWTRPSSVKQRSEETGKADDGKAPTVPPPLVSPGVASSGVRPAAATPVPAPLPSSGLVRMAPSANAIVATRLDRLRVAVQRKTTAFFVDGSGDRNSSTSALFRDLQRRIANPSHDITLFSSGDLRALLDVLRTHDALALNQRTDRFGTIASAAAPTRDNSAWVQTCT